MNLDAERRCYLEGVQRVTWVKPSSPPTLRGDCLAPGLESAFEQCASSLIFSQEPSAVGGENHLAQRLCGSGRECGCFLEVDRNLRDG